MGSEQVPVEILGQKRLDEVWNAFVRTKHETRTY